MMIGQYTDEQKKNNLFIYLLIYKLYIELANCI